VGELTTLNLLLATTTDLGMVSHISSQEGESINKLACSSARSELKLLQQWWYQAQLSLQPADGRLAFASFCRNIRR
jgi:hypothetical protein